MWIESHEREVESRIKECSFVGTTFHKRAVTEFESWKLDLVQGEATKFTTFCGHRGMPWLSSTNNSLYSEFLLYF